MVLPFNCVGVTKQFQRAQRLLTVAASAHGTLHLPEMPGKGALLEGLSEHLWIDFTTRRW